MTHAGRRSIVPVAARAALLSVSLGLAACGGNTHSFGRSGADIAYVGVAVGLTNPERYAHLSEGVELAFDSLNKVRPEGTPPLTLRRAPTSADSPVKIATAFRDDPSIVAVIGHTESDATIAAAQVYADRAHGGKDPVPVVTSAAALAVTRVSPWIFRVNVTIAEQGRVLARYADSLGFERAGVLYRNEASGKDFTKAFTDHWAALGFDAAMMIARAVHESGARRSAVHDWLGTVGKSRPAHPGVTGSITFDEYRDPVDKKLLVAEVGR